MNKSVGSKFNLSLMQEVIDRVDVAPGVVVGEEGCKVGGVAVEDDDDEDEPGDGHYSTGVGAETLNV